MPDLATSSPRPLASRGLRRLVRRYGRGVAGHLHGATIPSASTSGGRTRTSARASRARAASHGAPAQDEIGPLAVLVDEEVEVGGAVERVEREPHRDGLPLLRHHDLVPLPERRTPRLRSFWDGETAAGRRAALQTATATPA